MKLIGVIILAIIFCQHTNAQYTNASKYIWQNDLTKIKASVQIYETNYKKNNATIYFITNVDTTFNSYSDSLFTQFTASSILQYNVVKISFYDLYDTSKISLFSNEVINFILPDIIKKYKTIDKASTIISGVNDYAFIALYAATHYSDKINKTAIFFNEYMPNVMICNELAASSKLLKGKVFMYVNGEREDDFIINKLADNLALYSSIILYKYDDENSIASKYIFTEAYNWLMADGNNYVLKTED